MPAKKKRWQPPHDAATRAAALRPSRDSSYVPAAWMEPCLLECCEPLARHDANDWLGKDQPGETNGDRTGQTFAQFCRPGPRRSFPSKSQCVIYLTALGPADEAPAVAVLADCLRAYFLMDVVVGKPVAGKAFAALDIDDEGGAGYGPQLETTPCCDLLYSRKPRDAFISIGFTMFDICNTESGFNFLFGEAQLDKGCGIFSFARYRDRAADVEPRLFLRRCCMVLCHEATHLFGIKHCVFAACLMNGSNHLQEADRRPFDLCPVDMAKLRDSFRGAGIGGWDQLPPRATASSAAATSRREPEPELQSSQPRPGAGAKAAGGVVTDPLVRRDQAMLDFLETHGLEMDAEVYKRKLDFIRRTIAPCT